ncbi:MAG TPA: hypothetical protein VGD68_18155 [Streptosporangiaceae bacterium]
MTTPLPVGPLTPYVTPELLTQAPTGVSWSTIPSGSNVTDQQRTAELANICARATAKVDECCRQPLRATVDTLTLPGPGPRVYVPRDSPAGPCKLILKRWPVLEVLGIQVCPNTFPRSGWATIPVGMFEPAEPVSGMYGSVAPASAGEGGQGVRLAPGYVDWYRGKAGYLLEVQYVNGWPHTGLTAGAGEGATELQVDDCTGWAVTSAASGYTGATGTVYDAAAQEVIHVQSASAIAGPGTLTLAAPLQYSHSPGVMVSTLPQTVSWAAILFACSIAMTRGATATTVREIPGRATSTGGAKTPADFAQKAAHVLGNFARII